MKDTKSFIIHYQFTDEFADYLVEHGKRIICISYGYYNDLDLIVWED